MPEFKLKVFKFAEAMEEKLKTNKHNKLLESDKRRWELELELEDANNYRAGLEAIVDKLRAHVARMSEILSAAHIFIHINTKASGVNPDDLLLPKQIEEVLEGAPDYHNPADVEALSEFKLIEQILEYITNQENQTYDNAIKYFEKGNYQAYIKTLSQATTFQQVRYYIEILLEKLRDSGGMADTTSARGELPQR